jgi:phage-related protein
MNDEYKYKICFYKTSSGRNPIKKFLNDRRDCPPGEAAKIYEEFNFLRKKGYARVEDQKEGIYKNIKSEKGIYEMRINRGKLSYRLFFSYCQENVFMFYHIYKKTNDSSQDHEIKTAANRLREYQSSGICK